MNNIILNLSIYLLSALVTILFLLSLLWLIECKYVEFSYIYISVCLVSSFIFGARKLYKENFNTI